MLNLSNNSRIKSFTTVLILVGIPVFMVWWQVYDSAWSDAKLHPNEEGELMQQSHVELPVVSDAEQQQQQQLAGAVGNVAENHASQPSMVWLMSFPNSGTSYTMRLVQSATQRAVSTNYGPEGFHDPVYPGAQPEGPFWKAHEKETHPLPSKYILTKTHCGGRCVQCNQRKYISTLDQFIHDCTAGSGCMESKDGSSCQWKETHYPAPPGNPRIAKAIHLIRNPFDNIVSRFHLAHKKRSNEEPQKYQSFVEKYPVNATGFARWCLELDQEYGSPFDPKKVRVGSLGCQGEWFKYVQWHVLALGTIERGQLPSLTVHYEDYEAPKWNATLKTILDFLETPMEGNNAHEFESHPPYDYFTNQQRREARALVRRMAPDKVWALLQHYFD